MINPFASAWYTGDADFDFWLAVEISLVVSTIFGVAQQAPYGKLANDSLGSFHLSPRFGWWLMEIPASISFLATYFLTPSGAPNVTVSRVLAFIWIRHYGNRGWVFPFFMRVAEGSKASFSLTVSLIGASFTALHGHLNAKMFRALGTHYTSDWLTDPRFVVGLCICSWTLLPPLLPPSAILMPVLPLLPPLLSPLPNCLIAVLTSLAPHRRDRFLDDHPQRASHPPAAPGQQH